MGYGLWVMGYDVMGYESSDNFHWLIDIPCGMWYDLGVIRCGANAPLTLGRESDYGLRKTKL